MPNFLFLELMIPGFYLNMPFLNFECQVRYKSTPLSLQVWKNMAVAIISCIFPFQNTPFIKWANCDLQWISGYFKCFYANQKLNWTKQTFHDLICLWNMKSSEMKHTFLLLFFFNFPKIKQKKLFATKFLGDQASLKRDASVHSQTIGPTAYNCRQFFYECQEETSR